METFEKIGYSGLRSDPVPGTAQGILHVLLISLHTPRGGCCQYDSYGLYGCGILMPVLLIRN